MTIEMEHVRTLNNFKNDYNYLLKEFLTISKPHIGPTILITLKSDFSSIIKSERTADYIKSLEGLLRILEKRDRLSHDNIEPLLHISSNYVRDPELERLLTNYNERIKDRPFVPLFNVYDLPNGKYIIDNLRRDTRSVIIDASESIVQFIANNNEITNNNVTNCNINAPELSQSLFASAEDTLINETENFETNIIDQRTIYIVKVLHSIARHRIILLITFLGAISIIVFKKLSDVTSSAPLYETQPDNQHSSGSQIHQIRAQMTLFGTAEPSFHLTLPGIVNVGPSNQGLKEDDAEIAKIVLFEVSEKVGRHWRDVARFLGVTENDIDEIDLNCQWSLKEKALKALLKFQSKCEPLQWKTKLKGALEKARRRDLMEMVDDLLSQKYPTI